MRQVIIKPHPVPPPPYPVPLPACRQAGCPGEGVEKEWRGL